MKYERFEQLPVWQAGLELAQRVFRLTDNRAFRLKGDLANQLERAALSVSNNVAEGFERGTTNELIAFLYYARGSAGEVRSMLRLCERLPYFGAGPRSGPGPNPDSSSLKPDSSSLNPDSSSLKPDSSSLKPDSSNLMPEISNLRSEISNLIHVAESVSRQLRAWADCLQNSEIAGQRHLNDKTRRQYDHKQRADAFWRQLDELRAGQQMPVIETSDRVTKQPPS